MNQQQLSPLYICYSHIPKVFAENDLLRLLKMLPDKIITKSRDFINPERQAAFVIGQLLIMKVLKIFQFSENEIENLLYNSHGRPYLNDDIDFNISHSGDIVVCAGTRKNHIGIDIEKKFSVNPESLGCFTSEEYSEIHNATDPSVKVLEIWTKKESLTKAVGLGLSIDFENITLVNNKGYLKNDSREWFFYPLNFDDNFVCHVCSEKEVEIHSIREIIF